MSAVVLAAGEGERLRPLTHNRPKPLLPAGNRPIIDHVLDSLIDAGIEEIHIVVGYKNTRVQVDLLPRLKSRESRHRISGRARP